MAGPRTLLLILLAPSFIACGDDATPTLECGAGPSGARAPGGSAAVTPGSGLALRGAAIAAGAKTTAPAGEVTIACAPDISVEGFTPLGPAVSFGAEGTWSD